MSLLSNTCINTAVACFNQNEIEKSISYFYAARRFPISLAAEQNFRQLVALLEARVGQAQSEGVQQRAVLFDDLRLIFDAERRAALSTAEAKERAATRYETAFQRIADQDFEAAAANYFAAAALDPENPSGAFCKRELVATFVSRYQAMANTPLDLGSALALSLAVALDGVAGHADALRRLAVTHADHAMLIWLCDQLDAGPDLPLIKRLENHQDRLRAKFLLEGASEDFATCEAQKQTAEHVSSLIKLDPENLTARIARVQINNALSRYHEMLADLRFLLRYIPENPFVAHNILYLLQSARHPEVATSIQSILANSSTDPVELEAFYHFLIKAGATTGAFSLLPRLIPHRQDLACVAPLRAMSDDLDAPPAAVFGKAPTGRHLIYGSMVCWGEQYLKLMQQASLASLLAPGNMPTLARENDCVLELVTMKGDLELIISMPEISALSKYIEVRIYVFPESVESMKDNIGRIVYNLYGFASWMTIQRAARDGADFLMMHPDVILSDNSYAFISRHVSREPLAIMVDGLNAAAMPVLTTVERFRCAADHSLRVASDALSEIACANLMPRSTDFYFESGSEISSSYPQRVIFKEASGLRLHSFSQAPLYVSHAAFTPLGPINYTPPDAGFAAQVLNRLERRQVITVTDATELAIVELSDSDGIRWPKTRKPLLESIATFFLQYNPPLKTTALFLSEMRWPSRQPPPGPLTTAREREDFLAAYQEMILTNPVFVELMADRADFGHAAE